MKSLAYMGIYNMSANLCRHMSFSKHCIWSCHDRRILAVAPWLSVYMLAYRSDSHAKRKTCSSLLDSISCSV